MCNQHSFLAKPVFDTTTGQTIDYIFLDGYGFNHSHAVLCDLHGYRDSADEAGVIQLEAQPELVNDMIVSWNLHRNFGDVNEILPELKGKIFAYLNAKYPNLDTWKHPVRHIEDLIVKLLDLAKQDRRSVDDMLYEIFSYEDCSGLNLDNPVQFIQQLPICTLALELQRTYGVADDARVLQLMQEHQHQMPAILQIRNIARSYIQCCDDFTCDTVKTRELVDLLRYLVDQDWFKSEMAESFCGSDTDINAPQFVLAALLPRYVQPETRTALRSAWNEFDHTHLLDVLTTTEIEALVDIIGE